MKNISYSEIELIQAFKEDSAEAFEKISRVYYEQLYNFLWRKTRDQEISKDLIQELFINVWQHRKNLDEKKSFRAYLYKTANNLAINHLKQKLVNQKYVNERLSARNNYTKADTHELKEYIDDIMQGVPDEQRTVFMLNKFEGFKYAEIAEILEVSVKTVEARMSKILKTLREKLGYLLILLIIIVSILE